MEKLVKASPWRSGLGVAGCGFVGRGSAVLSLLGWARRLSPVRIRVLTQDKGDNTIHPNKSAFAEVSPLRSCLSQLRDGFFYGVIRWRSNRT